LLKLVLSDKGGLGRSSPNTVQIRWHYHDAMSLLLCHILLLWKMRPTRLV